MNTAFWDTFLTESLQKPWRVRPQTHCEPHSFLPLAKTRHVFVCCEEMTSQKVEMLNRMIAALKWSNQDVQVLNITLDQVEYLTAWSEPKEILFFGKDFPGHIGVIKNWFGHRIGQTYSLQVLLERAELKKQTWQHLQDFAGILV